MGDIAVTSANQIKKSSFNFNDYNWKLNFSQLTESIKKQKKKQTKKKELNDRLNIKRSFRGFSFGRSVKFFGRFL